LQFNSTKIALLLNVESSKFLSTLSFWVSFVGGVVTSGVVVVVIGRSLCCYTFANQ
jgi:hypothetical protein